MKARTVRGDLQTAVEETPVDNAEQIHHYDLLALEWATEKIASLNQEIWSLRALIDEDGSPQMRLFANRVRRVAP